MNRSKIDEFGAIFRLITPILIGIVGFFSIRYLSSIDQNFQNINNKFDAFIESYHKMDKRVDRLEYRVFGDKTIQTRSSLDN